MQPLTVPPRNVYTTFMDVPFVADLDRLDADFVIIGMPYGDPYTIDEVTNDQTNAPTAVRRATQRLSPFDHWDFDVGGTIFDGKPIKVVDVGDVPGESGDLKAHYRKAEAAVRKILQGRRGADHHRRRSRCADPGVSRLFRSRAGDADPLRRPSRLARSCERRARGLFQPDPARGRDAAFQGHLPDRPARPGQRPARGSAGSAGARRSFDLRQRSASHRR